MKNVRVRQNHNPKTKEKTCHTSRANFEAWVGYWRANPQRFITEYLGLPLYDFQKVLIWEMNNTANYIFIGSRGIASRYN